MTIARPRQAKQLCIEFMEAMEEGVPRLQQVSGSCKIIVKSLPLLANSIIGTSKVKLLCICQESPNVTNVVTNVCQRELISWLSSNFAACSAKCCLTAVTALIRYLRVNISALKRKLSNPSNGLGLL